MGRILSPEFYQQETIEVARQLIGQVLVHKLSDGTRLAGRIVETEAYLGPEDPACHTFGGHKSERVRAMYLEGGHVYVYLIYGMYNCFNVVTLKADQAEAVLIRALKPLEGFENMMKQRGLSGEGERVQKQIASGPGRMCQAMQIGREFNSHPLWKRPLWIEESTDEKNFEIDSDSRIGVDYSGDAAYWPLRFCLKNSPYLSRPVQPYL